MADDAVGDEVPRAGADIDHVDLVPEVFHGDDAEVGAGLHGGPYDVELPRQGRARDTEEALSRSQPAAKSNGAHVRGRLALAHGIEAEVCEALLDQIEQFGVRVRDSQDAAGAGPLRIEDPAQESREPLRGSVLRDPDVILEAGDVR